MDTKIRLYLISRIVAPILNTINGNNKYSFIHYNNRKQFYYLDLDMHHLSSGFIIITQDNNQVEFPLSDLNSTQLQNQKIYKLDQTGSYFIHQGQLHLIEHDDNCTSQNTDLEYRNKQLIYFLTINKIVPSHKIKLFIGKYLANKHQFQQNKLLLSLDLDGTLIGNRNQQIKYNLIWLKFFEFNKNKMQIFNTARNMLEISEELQDKSPLLWPQHCISQTGSCITEINKDEVIIDKEWEKMYVLNYNQQQIVDEIQKFHENEKIKPIIYFNNNSNIWMRYDVECQELRKKVDSYYRELQSELQKKGNLYQTIISYKEDACYNDVDIVSSKGGKGQSLEYVNAKTMKIDLKQNKDLIYSFGDTFTDSQMYEYSNVGVIQGNSIQNLKDWFQQLPNYKNIEDNDNIKHKIDNIENQCIVQSEYPLAKAITNELIQLLQGHSYF